ncbi:hypothetical protein [Streptomyces sp. G7(2002)]|uniref:hypothetical protein n=1 Tax=Streptomyces sp. G7(2002) TaxID=2971798 RepID=UPI00237DA114|nr:hypothetical protein [Streptomyces sp. G7(2002)]WDT58099.1 hypothetical protein NUT86_30905 [Streptomyces sp. G7(2002)]
MEAEASDNAVLTQVAGDYEEHHHTYQRAWQYLRASHFEEEEIDLVQQTYVHEAASAGQERQVDRAAKALSRAEGQRNVIALLGQAGTGRRTTALRVLMNAGVQGKNLCSLVLDWDRPNTEQIPHTPHHGFILDLSNYRSLPADFYQGIADYEKKARSVDAYLVILARPDAWNPGTLTTVPRVDHVAPPALEVARCHLRHRETQRLDWLADGSGPAGLLNDAASPGDAVWLAEIIANCAEVDRDQVEDAYRDWAKHLSTWFRNHDAPEHLRERALLISAALLDGCPADIVMRAADRLFTLVKGHLPPGGALAGPDLEERLKLIEAKRVDDTISLDASRRGLDKAVLLHVWEERPPLRETLLDWASQISAPKGVAVGHLPRIAQAVTQLAAGPDGHTVMQIVMQWTEANSAQHQRLAIGVLEAMAIDPVIGVSVRKLLYDWAGKKTASEALVETIAGVCAGALGLNYPRVALTRLRLLASRSDQRGAAAVAQAIRSLAEESDLSDLVLSEIVDWAESDSQAMQQAGATAFLALTDVTGEDPIGLQLAQKLSDAPSDILGKQPFVRGWRAAWRHQPTAAQATTSLTAWLDSPNVPDDHVIDICAAVLRGRLSDATVADLLVGQNVTTEAGRKRRINLVARLLPPPPESHIATDRAEKPQTIDTEEEFPDGAAGGQDPTTA